MINYDDFLKVDIRLGVIIDAQPFEKARKPAYKIEINFGPEIGIKKTSAQVTVNYQPQDLLGKKVMAVVNFPTKNIAGFESEVLLLGFADEHGAIVLAGVDKEVPLGKRLC